MILADHGLNFRSWNNGKNVSKMERAAYMAFLSEEGLFSEVSDNEVE